MSAYICPHCKNPICDDDALLCHFCGESLQRSVGFLGKIKYPTPKIVLAVTTVLVLLGFVILMIR